jgi:anti-sigma B factor antagonist
MSASSPARHIPPFDRTVPNGTRVVASVVGRRTVLTVTGEIDLASAPLLAEAIDDALDSGAVELWIDLGRLDFMDSSGLHVLHRANHRTRVLNRRLAVICPAGPVRRLFDIAGLVEHVSVYADRAAAHRGA